MNDRNCNVRIILLGFKLFKSVSMTGIRFRWFDSVFWWLVGRCFIHKLSRHWHGCYFLLFHKKLKNDDSIPSMILCLCQSYSCPLSARCNWLDARPTWFVFSFLIYGRGLNLYMLKLLNDWTWLQHQWPEKVFSTATVPEASHCPLWVWTFEVFPAWLTRSSESHP